MTLEEVFRAIPKEFIIWLDKQVPRDPYKSNPYDHAYLQGQNSLRNKILDLYANAVHNRWIEPVKQTKGSDILTMFEETKE